MRVIYQPNETHPWNHFSKTTTGHVIEFYDMAFAEYSDLVTIGNESQSWMFKEWFSFVALIGFFLLFVPVIYYITRLPFFKEVFTKKPAPLKEPTTNGGKLANLILVLFGALFPALLFTSFYSGDETGMRMLRQVSLIIIAVAVIAFIYALVKNAQKNIKTVSIIMAILGLIQYFYLKNQSKLFNTTELFGAPTTNQVVFWAVNVAIITLMVMVTYHYVSKKEEGATVENYGVKANAVTVISALVTAIVAIAIGYGLLFLIDALFKTDFRIWTFAVKTFEGHHLIALLKYAPLFFIYYFIVGTSVNTITASEEFDGIKGYIVSILMFIGGLLLYLGYHYGLLFTTGVAGYPSESLSSIIVIGLIPVLTVAAIFNRYFFRRTGNVYLGAFLNTILMTLITLANTALYTVF